MSTAVKEYRLGQNDRFLKKTFGRYLFPTMLATLGGTINTFTDGIIVGQSVGADGLAAVSISMPIYLILCTIGSLFVSGGCVCSSHAIGEGDMKKAARIYNSVVLYTAVISLIITIIGGLLSVPIAALLAGGSSLYPLVHTYSLVTLLGSGAKIMLYVPIYYLRLDGRNRQSSITALFMTAINIALDLLFIFVFEMGIFGAALASVLASAFACVMGFVFLAKSDNFRFKREFENIRLILSVIKCGSPSAMDNLMAALRVLFLNSVLLSFGGNIMVSVFSVVNNISEFALFIVNGIPQTAAPLIGVYSAEKNKWGLKIIVKNELKAAMASSLLFGIVISVFAEPIGRMFGVDYPVSGAVICLACGLVIGCINNIMAGFYGNSGHVGIANTVTISRIFGFTVITASLLINLGGYVWLFLPLTEGLTFILLLAVLGITHFRNKSRTFFLFNEKGGKGGEQVLDFSVSSGSEDICSASEKISDFCAENNMSPAQTMKISLAIEEILTVMAEKCFDGSREQTFDLRAFVTEENTGIRIRCLGRQFNPMTLAAEECDEGMGVKMIAAMAKSVEYQCVLGANSLMIII